MTKLLPSLALALVVTSGLAAPAFAAGESLTSGSTSGFDADYALQALHDKGVNVVDVTEDWNGQIRATVALDDGSRVTQYFTESFQPIVRKSGNTRVMSKLDTGRAPLAVSVNSLTYQGDQPTSK